MDLVNDGNDEAISKRSENEWSIWLDFNRETISSLVPEDSGLFKIHASMKVLYIGIAQNLKKALQDSIVDPCLRKGQRFSYMVNHDSLDNLKMELLKDYKLRHNGKLPACMESAM
jgi:hypothetical protein